MQSFPLLPSNVPAAAATTEPNLNWENSLNSIERFFDLDWENAEMKRRKSAPASQQPSVSHLSATSDALVPDWSQELSINDGSGYPLRGGSLPKVCLATICSS